MELLGPSIIEVVNRQKPYKFTLSQVLQFGIQGIESLSSIHSHGFVHRDIKPGNFVIGNTVETSGIFYLIDFGLCKRLQYQDGVVIKPPQNGSFRGTLRYASIQAHKKEELGRNDDLMSLFCIMIEFYVGKLPWMRCIDSKRTFVGVIYLSINFQNSSQKLKDTQQVWITSMNLIMKKSNQ
ncbi:MAG: hypothetical protein EZS28_042842 [Streblomastix strix]|uniref:non-specific serine/threonine protein kinase n=1 Tax=Streblomastix strix TaxID=222440 RepID=A0A5J4TVN7_9EUKA|nr:MAG: hypothetical protein EZS28_042842 [Streblomastix strix]